MSLPQAGRGNTTRRGLPSAFGSSHWENNPWETTRPPRPRHCPAACFARALTLTPGITWESVWVNHRAFDGDRETRKGLQQPGHWSRQTKFITCSAQAVKCHQWLCSSAEPSWGHTLTGKLGEGQIHLIQIPKQGILLILEPGVPQPRQGAASQLPYCGECFCSCRVARAAPGGSRLWCCPRGKVSGNS